MTEYDRDEYAKLSTRDLAIYVFRNPARADYWLAEPNVWLNPKGYEGPRQSPNDLIAAGREADVRRYLYQIIENVYV